MAPEGGELARSCAPATHNRVLLLHTQTRPPKRTLSRRGAVSCLWRARARTCFRCTYVYTRARTGPRTSLGLCALLDSRYPHAHRRTQVLVYIYIYVRALVSRTERIVCCVQHRCLPFPSCVSGLSVWLVARGTGSRVCVSSWTRTCAGAYLRSRASERASETEKGKRRTRGRDRKGEERKRATTRVCVRE